MCIMDRTKQVLCYHRLNNCSNRNQKNITLFHDVCNKKNTLPASINQWLTLESSMIVCLSIPLETCVAFDSSCTSNQSIHFDNIASAFEWLVNGFKSIPESSTSSSISSSSTAVTFKIICSSFKTSNPPSCLSFSNQSVTSFVDNISLCSPLLQSCTISSTLTGSVSSDSHVTVLGTTTSIQCLPHDYSPVSTILKLQSLADRRWMLIQNCKGYMPRPLWVKQIIMSVRNWCATATPSTGSKSTISEHQNGDNHYRNAVKTEQHNGTFYTDATTVYMHIRPTNAPSNNI
ncbi:hypothetical protein AGLY_006502 [Aphis glycines]|uniref:Uncharacterized protein n=1 Tax=Aphis glycines TaxID=307491 RepID=A0A6G0TS53_APHGL|nr:hypothetical protein AGLY_006502 [Aphis glycines]